MSKFPKKERAKRKAYLGSVDLLVDAILVLIRDGVEDLGLDVLSLSLGLRLTGVGTSLSALLSFFLLSVGHTSSVGESSRRLREGLTGLSGSSSTVVRRLTVGVTSRSRIGGRAGSGSEVGRRGRGTLSSDVRSSGTSLSLLSVVGSVGDVLSAFSSFLLDLLLLLLSLFLEALGFVALGGETSIGNVRGVITNFSVRTDPLLTNEQVSKIEN